MANYYNDNDAFTGSWLRNLIRKKLIPNGFVSTRPIQRATSVDVSRFRQVHFFAGIGGWSRALQLAGWPKDQEVWTGSCPCQPFSSAGKRRGQEDERNLWPFFRRLIEECNPPVVFGEQVASDDGRAWFARVRSDLEVLGYAVGAADLCAAGARAPHIRQRLFWMACRMGNTNGIRLQLRKSLPHSSTSSSGARVLRSNISAGHGIPNFWTPSNVIACKDSRSRRIEPGTSALAHGVSQSVELLRGYGNSIVPQVAAKFIVASVDAINLLRSI